MKLTHYLFTIVFFVSFTGCTQEKGTNDNAGTPENVGTLENSCAAEHETSLTKADTTSEPSGNETAPAQTASEEPIAEVAEVAPESGPTMTVAEAGKVLSACKSCHYLDKGGNKVRSGLGPGLKGVYGRKPVVRGVPFKTWTAANLDKWLTNPRAVFRRTRMNYKISDSAKRKKAVEALKSL